MSVDILALTISLGPRYPSKNQEGRDDRRGGRKSDEYRDLFDAVKSTAEREIERTGWQRADCECLTVITRYIPDRRRCDSLNIGTAEANALTSAGVWDDDRLAQPCIKQIRHDSAGAHRISIVVMKLHQPANVIALESRVKRTAPKLQPVADDSSKPQRYMGGAIPPGFAVVNGELVPRDVALKMMAK